MVAVSLALSLLVAAGPAVKPLADSGKPIATEKTAAVKEKHPPLYTTYFYTAGEAVVHGYEAGTNVRIVSLEKGGTIWQGTVGEGETKTVSTGMGVFGFLSDKKAAILVGTPTSCAVVGYFLKDQNGEFRSNHFFTQLPSSTYSNEEKVVVWAYEDADVQVIDRKTGEVLHTKKLAGGEHLTMAGHDLVGNRVLEFKSEGSKIGVEVYYDEGFIVPAANGRGSGHEFYTYVGSLTTGVNDLNILSQISDANVTVTDLETKQTIFKGTVKRGQIKTMTMAKK